MSTIQTARYEQFTRRLLRLVGGSIMPRLQNDLSPVINIEDPADEALLFWKGHRIACGLCIGTADALEFSVSSIFNPVGSGILVVVRQIVVGPATRTWRIALTQDRTGTVQTGLAFNDGRASLTSVPKVELGFDSLAAQPTLIWQVGQTTGQARPDNFPPIVLPPGVGLQVWPSTVASLANVSFAWLERSAETPELEG